MSSASIHLRDHDEIESFYVETTGMKPDYVQLSAGRAGISLKVDEFEGLSLVWSRVEGKSRWRDVVEGTGLHIGCQIGQEGTMSSFGNVLQPDTLGVWVPGQEIEYLTDGPFMALEIGIEDWLATELGWMVEGEPFRRISPSALNRLKFKATKISLAMSHYGKSASRGELNEWRDDLLDEVDPVLQPWIDSPDRRHSSYHRTRSYRTVHRAEEIFERLGGNELSIDEMAAEAGVPRRTFFHAFRKTLGISPRRFFELIRLNRLRHQLKHPGGPNANVTILATELGFTNLGRLAALYREQFGEYPNETLSRSTH